jgi:hypothetical protein
VLMATHASLLSPLRVSALFCVRGSFIVGHGFGYIVK